MSRRHDQEVLRSLGLRIREARIRAGLSQERLAAEIGIATNNISNVETGKKGLSLATVLAIARSLGVAPGELFDGTTPLTGPAMPARARNLLSIFEQLGSADQELALAIVRDVLRHRVAPRADGAAGDAAAPEPTSEAGRREG